MPKPTMTDADALLQTGLTIHATARDNVTPKSTMGNGKSSVSPVASRSLPRSATYDVVTVRLSVVITPHGSPEGQTAYANKILLSDVWQRNRPGTWR